jgi:prophage regulatory protein
MANHSLPTAPCVQILRLPQVCKVTGLGRSMIYQLEAQRRFPCRVRIGARAVGWVEAEVQGWLVGRMEHHRAGGGCKAAPTRAAAGLATPRAPCRCG